jgi:putative ABC transport system permease protein
MLYRMGPNEPARGSRAMSVSPGYFRTVGTPLIEGREFTDGDRGGPLVVIINEALARGLIQIRSS